MGKDNNELKSIVGKSKTVVISRGTQVLCGVFYFSRGCWALKAKMKNLNYLSLLLDIMRKSVPAPQLSLSGTSLISPKKPPPITSGPKKDTPSPTTAVSKTLPTKSTLSTTKIPPRKPAISVAFPKPVLSPSPAGGSTPKPLASQPEPPKPVAQALEEPPPLNNTGPGRVKLLYNHYQEFFATLDGCISALTIDETYCFHAAFKGDFRLHLIPLNPGGQRAKEVVPNTAPIATPQSKLEGGEVEEAEEGVHLHPHACGGVVFTELTNDSVWKVLVEDDPRYAPKGPPTPLFVSGRVGEMDVRVRGGGGGLGKKAADLLTQELKNLDVEELRAGSERYKALLEAREVEAALYG